VIVEDGQMSLHSSRSSARFSMAMAMNSATVSGCEVLPCCAAVALAVDQLDDPSTRP